MSNFICKKCGKQCIDSPIGYITGCEHYPPDMIETPSDDGLKRTDLLNIPIFLRRFQPKGGMCATCKKLDQDCSVLRFENMPIIATDGNMKIVRCTEHVRSNA